MAPNPRDRYVGEVPTIVELNGNEFGTAQTSVDSVR